jgi:hypothetical protein
MESFKGKREDKEKHLARERLYNNCVKRINTTMIGAIATIEECMGTGKDFDAVRSKILDKGNNQIRILSSDFDQYDIKFKNSVTLPIERK